MSANIFDILFPNSKRFYVGVSTSKFNDIYATQQNSMWCWAACVQMMLRHYGVNIAQRELAGIICGVSYDGIPNNCPAQFNVITNYLNSCWENYNEEYCLTAPENYGRPNLYRLYNELKNGNPVIVTYNNPNSNIGHAVLITGIEYYFLGTQIYVTKFILRDPWPSYQNRTNNGRVVKSNAKNFADSITAHWFVNLTISEKVEYYWGNRYF